MQKKTKSSNKIERMWANTNDDNTYLTTSYGFQI